jgi:hypothetical protein
VQPTDVLTRPQPSMAGPRLRLGRRVLFTLAVVFAVGGLGAWRGLSPEYPCSPGYTESTAAITATVRVCLDHNNRCVPIPHTAGDQQSFTLPSCVPIRGRG